MKNYDSDSHDAILKRLKPITLYLSSIMDMEVIQGESNKILTYRRTVAIENNQSCFLSCCELVFCDAFNDEQMVMYPPMGVIIKSNFQMVERPACERLECVYDPVGTTGSYDGNLLTSYHALMMPPQNGELGACFALLRIDNDISAETEDKWIVSVTEDSCWAKYATDYAGVKLLPLMCSPKEVRKRENPIVGMPKIKKYKPLYIGDTPICAKNVITDELISYEEFENL